MNLLFAFGWLTICQRRLVFSILVWLTPGGLVPVFTTPIDIYMRQQRVNPPASDC